MARPLEGFQVGREKRFEKWGPHINNNLSQVSSTIINPFIRNPNAHCGAPLTAPGAPNWP